LVDSYRDHRFIRGVQLVATLSRDVLAPTSAYMFEADLTNTGEHGADWTKASWLIPF
jgi:hypothetical protein